MMYLFTLKMCLIALGDVKHSLADSGVLHKWTQEGKAYGHKDFWHGIKESDDH